MDEQEKLEAVMRGADVGAISVTIAAWAGYLPAVASLLTILYLSIRIWETSTVIGWRRAFKRVLRREE